jgi:putative effector of murein hydrolase
MTLVWAQFTSSPAFALALTLAAYEIGRHLQQQFGSSPLINPVLIAIILVGCSLGATGISYEQYFDGALGGAFSGLGLGLCGLATAALMPLLNWLLWHH